MPAPVRCVRPSTRWHRHLDLTGAGLSLACALHCAALPLLLAFVPAAMLALRSFQHPAHGAMTLLLVLSRWEWAFALIASTIALSSTLIGARRHHRRLPMLMAGCGAVLLLAASLIEPLKESLTGHAVATCVGGTLLAAAYWRNRRLLQARRGQAHY